MKGMIGYTLQTVASTIGSARCNQLTNLLRGAVQNKKPETKCDAILKIEISWIKMKAILLDRILFKVIADLAP